MRRGWQRSIQERLERLTVEHADAVVLNTQEMSDEFSAHYGVALASKFVVIPNGYDTEHLEPILSAPTAKRERFTLIHAGSLYNRRNPLPFVHAIASLISGGSVAREALQVIFLGSVAPEYDIGGLTGELGLDGVVRVEESVPHQESLRRLISADVLLVIQPGTELQVPAKLYEYMGLRKPVLALADPGAVANLVRRGNLGLVAAADDPQAIAQAVLRLFTERDRLGSMFQPLEDVRRQFEGRALSDRLNDLLLRLLRQ
jgi:glycosyltransferase involved in cell wall biosynthesis